MNIQQAKQLAQNSSISSQTLQDIAERYSDLLDLELSGELIKCNCKELFKHILSNPNCPLDLFKKYFRDFPIQILNNISIHFVLLETPAFFNDIDYMRHRLFDLEGLPDWFLQWAAKHSNTRIRASLAIGKATPICFLEKLSLDKELMVRNYLTFNSSCPNAVKEKLSKDSLEYIPF